MSWWKKHIHEWGKWEIDSQETIAVDVMGAHRFDVLIIIQKRICGGCGYTQFDKEELQKGDTIDYGDY